MKFESVSSKICYSGLSFKNRKMVDLSTCQAFKSKYFAIEMHVQADFGIQALDFFLV